jgi:hypothetical protein
VEGLFIVLAVGLIAVAGFAVASAVIYIVNFIPQVFQHRED